MSTRSAMAKRVGVRNGETRKGAVGPPARRTALVTGASRGIGRAIAAELDALGYRVLAPTRAALDLSDPVSVESFCERLSEPVDVLINNAGINPLKHLRDLTAAEVHSVLQVNVVAAMCLTARLAPEMALRGWGRIVNISSIWSSRGRSRRAMYAASKAALDALTRATAVEFSSRGVLANSVAPGFVDTELTRKNLSAAELKKLEKIIPVGRLGSDTSIAKLVAFLASESNDFINGQVIVADGGFLCQ